MMNKIFLLLFVSIMSSPYSHAEDSAADALRKACKKSEVCAVGEGDTAGIAEKNARVALSKIFNTTISSKFSSALKSRGADVEENVSEEINEATDSALAGIETKKTTETKTNFYALVGLNKAKAAEGFKRQINALDDQMKVISKDGESIEKVKLERIFVKRETLHDQYHFLTGMKISPPLSYEEIFSAKKDASKNVVVHIYLDEDEPKFVEAVLQKNISDLGFKSTSGQVRNKNSTHVITGEFSADKQYLNVEGFEKYKFVLKVKAMKAGTNVESGHLNYEVVETGRNYSQAVDLAQPKIQNFIKENIEKLNLN